MPRPGPEPRGNVHRRGHVDGELTWAAQEHTDIHPSRFLAAALVAVALLGAAPDASAQALRRNLSSYLLLTMKRASLIRVCGLAATIVSSSPGRVQFQVPALAKRACPVEFVSSAGSFLGNQAPTVP
jgi:hypothetical protein